MPKTASEVIAEIFAGAEVDQATEGVVEQLRELWDSGNWTDAAIIAVLQAQEQRA
jgi:hypothetical protein